VFQFGDENTCLGAGVGTGVAVGVGVALRLAVGVAVLLPWSPAAKAVPTKHDKKMVARIKITNVLSSLNTSIPPTSTGRMMAGSAPESGPAIYFAHKHLFDYIVFHYMVKEQKIV
jgi:hypothetical protein